MRFRRNAFSQKDVHVTILRTNISRIRAKLSPGGPWAPPPLPARGTQSTLRAPLLPWSLPGSSPVVLSVHLVGLSVHFLARSW